ncbi:hypothetical protein M436DRAFT_72873 [Aureobasidium namibiae CBS 147.97]|uniref:Uncharacterized protein n=1 Tax=Aureobasidium namibiae CBS 147.97 TaxID=1043004 RepID=A0A074WKI2_9PEZI|nr:uncharacterized protein M436DRAFT_72873 [Aureobasidium namibiae CBS 147.97]KEQ73588.1 hypothetical protein M436DRAFT_72873 [Aureobasidium namibiae CBS 147.97]
MSLQALQANRDLWYKIQVLLYDLCNIVTDRTAESRTLATTDELYISAPYLAADEAALVKQTRISPPTLQEISDAPCHHRRNIKGCLENFFEKRRASGDARPCDPHDMGPIYLAVFGVSKEELRDEKFLSRLRRAGLPRLDEAETEKNNEHMSRKGRKKDREKGGRKGRKG